jgi:hypothetical protein
LHNWVVLANNIEEVDDLLIEFSMVKHLVFQLNHHHVELLNQANVSNHVLEPSFLHIIKTFYVIANLSNYLFYLENGFFCLPWCSLFLILNAPYNLIMEHLLNILLKIPLLKQKLNMSMIIIITNNQTRLHQLIDKKFFLIKFFDHYFQGLSSYVLFGVVVEDVVHENLVFDVVDVQFFGFFELGELRSHEAVGVFADFEMVLHSVMLPCFNLIHLLLNTFIKWTRLENILKLIFNIKSLNIFIVSQFWVQTSFLKLSELR